MLNKVQNKKTKRKSKQVILKKVIVSLIIKIVKYWHNHNINICSLIGLHFYINWINQNIFQIINQFFIQTLLQNIYSPYYFLIQLISELITSHFQINLSKPLYKLTLMNYLKYLIKMEMIGLIIEKLVPFLKVFAYNRNNQEILLENYLNH